MRRDKDESTAIGRVAEAAVVDWLRNVCGEFVIWYKDDPEKGRGAPMLRGPGDAIVAMDLQAFKKGIPRWWEVKWKASATPKMTDNARLDTGVNWGNWLDYLECEKLSGIPGNIIWLHRQQNEVITATLGNLKAYGARHVDKQYPNKPRYNVALWPTSIMDRICAYDEILTDSMIPSELRVKLLDPERFKCVYGAPPPRLERNRVEPAQMKLF